eukprot:6180663-Pleurochrysis_carterae.AAC.4
MAYFAVNACQGPIAATSAFQGSIYFSRGRYSRIIMAAIMDLGESNQLAIIAIPGSHLRIFRVAPIDLDKRTLSGEERQLLNTVAYRISPYGEDQLHTPNKDVKKATANVMSLGAQHRVLAPGVHYKEHLS